jgi:hypothetical protein
MTDPPAEPPHPPLASSDHPEAADAAPARVAAFTDHRLTFVEWRRTDDLARVRFLLRNATYSGFARYLPFSSARIRSARAGPVTRSAVTCSVAAAWTSM